MSVNVGPLLKQYEEKASQIQSLMTSSAEWKQEDLDRVDTLNREADDIYKQISRLQQAGRASEEQAKRLSELKTAYMPAPHPGGAQVVGLEGKAGETVIDRATGQLYHDGVGMMSEKILDKIRQPLYKDAWRAYLRAGGQPIAAKHAEALGEVKALQEGLDQSGGYLAPEDIQARLISKEPTPTRVTGYVTQLNTGRDTITFPKVVYTTDDLYTTGMRVTWTGEAPATSTVHLATDPQFGQVRIPIYTAMISLPVTRDMLEDSMFPLEAWIAMKFRETYDLLRDNMILNGTGVGQPSGILQNPGGTNEPATVVSGAAAAVTADGLMDLAYAVPEQYDDNFRWVFNKTNTGKAIAKLKDADNRYLFATGSNDDKLASARPRELIGYPFAYSGFMPNVGANTYPIIGGDLRGYYLVERVGFSIEVLREIQALTNQVVVLGRFRFGGDVAEDWRIKVQKIST